MDKIHFMILVVSGTNRRNSKTNQVANIYCNLIKAEGMRCKLLSLENLPDAFLHPDNYDESNPEIELIQTEYINPASKFVFVIPEYHGDYPGVLKLFIDMIDVKSGLKNKKAALAGVADGRHGNVRGLGSLTGVLHHLNVFVLPYHVTISNLNKELDENGELKSQPTLMRIQNQVKQLIAL